ncbi:hypothetical protein [Sporosarcina sp. FSL K6-2383]|uniref:hypothetical protein n=1 Tax=Sporosarcina sp. FSL K6-2383 TaxID=2921556 RepID=UPI003159FEFD
MKRLIFVLVMSMLFLVACGVDELEEFTKEFNQRALKDDVPELVMDEFGDIEIEEVENMGWQQLYESDSYYIDAKYKDGEKLSGYHLVIDKSEPFEEFEGEGYKAGLSIIKTLGLDAGDYVRGYGTALSEGRGLYIENGYKVSFTYPGSSGITSVGMIINFDKE